MANKKQWLYLTDPMMHGPAVRRWQELLDSIGYELATDGWFGKVTDRETREAQAAFGVKVDGIVGPKTMDAAHDALGEPEDDSQPQVIQGVEVFDYRGQVPPPKNGRWTRKWSSISGVVLHRTACRLGERPERYFPVNAHIGVTLGGRIVLAHPWEMMIWHGHYPSRWTIGIEFDGNPEGYPAKDGKPAYYWKPGGGPDPITDEQVKAGMVLLGLLQDAFSKNGQTFKYIYAHKQSSDQRECDPGWECWEKIAVPWMAKSGAVPGDIGWQGTVFGTGYHVSQHWDKRSPVKGYRVR